MFIYKYNRATTADAISRYAKMIFLYDNRFMMYHV